MRSILVAALILAGAALPAAAAFAVDIPAPDAGQDGQERMTRLPDDWLDDDLPDPEAEKADMRAAEAERWEERGSARGEAGSPVAGVDCPKPSGTTGAILGAVAGGLLGNVVDGGRHRAAGTILGAGGGALLGREVEQRSTKCR